MKRINLIEPENTEISITRQCSLLSISRSQYYYEPQPESEENLSIMKEMDKAYIKHPYYGVRRLREHIKNEMKISVNTKRIRRLMRLMGMDAIYCKPNLSKPNILHKIYPYLLRNVPITHNNHVWSTDITYIPMKKGSMYLTAIIDWHSRYVLSWGISNSLEMSNCKETLIEALKIGKPEIFNSDQGSQFTSPKFTEILEKEDIEISMDGKGRALDNIFVERLWRTVKYELIYLHEFKDGLELYNALQEYFEFYNNKRRHQSLDYKTPAEVYFNNYSQASTKVC
jgi:putative transposase